MFQINVVEKIRTHIRRSVTISFRKLSVDEIMWKNIVKPDRPQTTIWRMRFACWIYEAKHTQSEYEVGQINLRNVTEFFTQRTRNITEKLGRVGTEFIKKLMFRSFA
jgi:hypothetical protein